MPNTSASSVRSALVLAVAVVVSTAGAGGCSGGSSGGGGGNVCTPGAQVSCACPGGTTGAQACKSDGSGYDPCDCTGGQDASVDTGSTADSGSDSSTSDSGADSAKADSATDGPGSDGGGPCDPIAQTGCVTGQKCTWIRNTVTPMVTGHLGCEADGTVGLHGACTFGASGPTTGFDDCQKGFECIAPQTEAAAGECLATCDQSAQSGPGVCTTNYFCNIYGGYFDSAVDGGATSLGMCKSTCDPLTQTRSYDSAVACGGGMSGGYPVLGCYGLPSTTTKPTLFQCAGNFNPTNTSDTPVAPPVFVNSCASGYAPALVQSWQSTTAICAAFCEPGNTSSTSTANAAGVPGSGYTCPDRGAGGTHECRYLWWFEGATTPISSVDNSVGLCFDYAQYKYNSNTVTDPSCTTLSSTGHTFSATQTDTQYWGCESVTSRPMFRERSGMPVIQLLDMPHL